MMCCSLKISACWERSAGIQTPAYQQGRYMIDPDDSGLSEHAVHHFHSLVRKAYLDI